MVTIKSFTDLQQSKKLAEFLPHESADCYWEDDMSVEFGHGWHSQHIPCWSLAALLSILPIIGEDKDTANPFIAKTLPGEYYVVYATLYKEIDSSGIYSNPVDACYEMILKLHEQNLL